MNSRRLATSLQALGERIIQLKMGRLKGTGGEIGRCLSRVTGCLPECVTATAAVRQIAADLLRRESRQHWAISGNHQWFNREVGSGSGQLFNPPNEPSDRPGTLRYLLAGATETPCRCAASIARPTRPEAFASSTNSAT
jgi:hypothetical protein